MSLFFGTASNLRVLEVVRHPVTLAASWYNRGLGERWDTDPRVFSVMADWQGHAIPWFALDWAENFVNASPMDRVVRSVLTLLNACDDGFDSLDDAQRDRILFVPYEKLIGETRETVGKIGRFLGSDPLPTIEDVYTREKLPKTAGSKSLSECMALIKSHSSPDLVNQLIDAGRVYEEKWDCAP